MLPINQSTHSASALTENLGTGASSSHSRPNQISKTTHLIIFISQSSPTHLTNLTIITFTHLTNLTFTSSWAKAISSTQIYKWTHQQEQELATEEEVCVVGSEEEEAADEIFISFLCDQWWDGETAEQSGRELIHFAVGKGKADWKWKSRTLFLSTHGADFFCSMT